MDLLPQYFSASGLRTTTFAPVLFFLLLLISLYLLSLSDRNDNSSDGHSAHLHPRAEAFVESHDAEVTAFRNRLVGTWQLQRYVYNLHGPVTVSTYPHGQSPVGQLLYLSDGSMSVHIMEPGCTLFKGSRPHHGTKDEMANAMSYYQAYSGRFVTGYFGKDKVLAVKHIVKTALYPNWVGIDQLRIAKMKDDELILTPEVLHNWHGVDVEAVLVWARPKVP